MHTKAKFLYLCARITNTRRYETHHYGAGAENLQGVLPDDGRHDAVLFCMDRMHHARRRYRRRCHGPFARAVPCRGTLGRHKYPDRYDGFPDQRRAAARGGVHHRMELRREDRVLRLRHIVGAEFLAVGAARGGFPPSGTDPFGDPGRHPGGYRRGDMLHAGRLDGRHGHRRHDYQQVPHDQLRQDRHLFGLRDHRLLDARGVPYRHGDLRLRDDRGLRLYGRHDHGREPAVEPGIHRHARL